MSESSHSQTAEDHPVSCVDTRVLLRSRALRAAVVPRMRGLHDHLKLFVETKGADAVRVSAAYPIEDLGTLAIYALEKFELVVDDEEVPSFIKLSCEARGRGPLKLLPRSSDDYFRIRRSLFDCQLDFSSGIAATVSKITIQPKVPVHLCFESDLSRGLVMLTTTNLTQLGTRAFELKLEVLERRFFEALCHQLCDQPSDFLELAGPPANGQRPLT